MLHLVGVRHREVHARPFLLVSAGGQQRHGGESEGRDRSGARPSPGPGCGTDVALETADIALMADDLSKLATTIRLARRAERIIRANIALSLLTKAVFVALVVTGHATLWMAVAADMGTSLLVVLNGLRALGDG